MTVAVLDRKGQFTFVSFRATRLAGEAYKSRPPLLLLLLLLLSTTRLSQFWIVRDNFTFASFLSSCQSLFSRRFLRSRQSLFSRRFLRSRQSLFSRCFLRSRQSPFLLSFPTLLSALTLLLYRALGGGKPQPRTHFYAASFHRCNARERERESRRRGPFYTRPSALAPLPPARSRHPSGWVGL
jgi:hypothetical protein